jgi:hypothetical protein
MEYHAEKLSITTFHQEGVVYRWVRAERSAHACFSTLPVEVYVQDWKSHEGWNQLTTQPGDDGACHSVLLSLLHEVFAFGRSKKHLIQRQLGRLEPTPHLKYRAKEVLRHMPVPLVSGKLWR